MNKLRDMVRKKNKMSTMAMPEVSSDYDEEKYPYGLRISLEKEDIDKLDLNLKNINIDDEIKIEAVGYIESLRQNKTRRGEDKNLGIQITAMVLKKKKNKS